MDAPVAGTKSPAEKGDLVFLVGGNQEDLDEIRPLLDVMGKQVIHAGPVGSGTALKMLFNLLLGVGMAAFSEALLLGEGLGLKRDFLLDTLIGSAVAPPFLAGKRSKIEAGDYTADFPLQWMQKDLHLAALSGFEQDVSLPATNVVKEIYMLAKKAGLAGQDFAALYEYLKK
jgi:3-hydroxyisobutyrate dehydrogenase/glyoxylate/succinic semialdehyde reductase